MRDTRTDAPDESSDPVADAPVREPDRPDEDPPVVVPPIWHRRDQWVLAILAGLVLVWIAWDWAASTRCGLDTIHVERGPDRPLDYRIDVNTANWVQWRNLPGIGDVLARRVVADRDRHGPFATIDDLDRVRGIGPKLLDRIRPYVFVGDRPADANRQP